MLYDVIDEKTIETEIKKGVMKARYAWMNTDDKTKNIDSSVENVSDINEAVVFSLGEKKADYANIKATDLPSVQRLFPPKPATLQKESELQTLKNKLMGKVREYREKRCNSKGHIRSCNISKTKKNGLKELTKLKRKKYLSSPQTSQEN